MKQPIKIQLNAEALAALFPEGSAARIELQNAVVAEFVRKNLRDRALGNDVFETIDRARVDASAAVERARRDIMDRSLAEAGLKKEYGGFKLQGEAETLIKSTARNMVERAAREAADAAAEAAVEKIKTDLDAAVQRRINAITDTNIRAAVKAHLDAVMASIAKSGGAA